MAEEVVKTIENVDRLFARIVVNGEVHESQNYVPQDSTDSVIAPQINEENSQSDSQEPIAQPAQGVGEDVYAVVLNDTKHDFVDPETVQNLSQEVVARQNMDNQLQQGINGLTGDMADLGNDIDSLTGDVADLGNDIDSLTGDVADLGNDIDSINVKIPNQASSSNQLADKDFVNSSIATNTANFLGTYTSMADIEAIQNPTNNDYVFLQTTDSSGNNLFDRYKYNTEQDEWLFEYELNNSSFTAQQWATINSGLTQGSVDQDILDAINALDVASQGGNNKYIKAIQQTNGLISATEGNVDTTVTQNSSNPVTSGAVYDAIQSSGGGLDWATIKQNIATDLGLTASQYNGNSATATVAYRIRTSTPSSPVDGDIWIE